jgi:ABC-type phosphate transport system permease subunit
MMSKHKKRWRIEEKKEIIFEALGPFLSTMKPFLIALLFSLPMLLGSVFFLEEFSQLAY